MQAGPTDFPGAPRSEDALTCGYFSGGTPMRQIESLAWPTVIKPLDNYHLVTAEKYIATQHYGERIGRRNAD
jgi:hypothetical protein